MASVTNVGDQYALPTVTPNQTKVLGQDEFLTLMISQLQNQDPTEPMDNSQMASQMAQFSSLENMKAMSSSIQQSQTYNMIGKGVLGFTTNAETGIKSEVMGVVESAGVSGGVSYVMVGDVKVNVTDITQVYDQNALTGISDAVIAAGDMVGRFARANLGTATNPNWLEGQVSRWQLQNGVVTLTINDTDVLMGQIVTIADSVSALGEAPPAVEVPVPETPAASEDEEES